MNTASRSLGLLLAAAALLGHAVRAADAEPGESAARIERGKRLYGVYCLTCHGPLGKGDGATARDLPTPPSDLTRISRANGGEFPFDRVVRTIDGRSETPGHERQMQIWGIALQEWDTDADQSEQVAEKIRNLALYLQSIQVADPE